jgi:hypothetical protein
LPIQFAASLLVMVLLHFVAKQEVLRRIVDVLVPILLYLYFSYKSNSLHSGNHSTIDINEHALQNRLRGYLHYLVTNPAFSITLITIAYFAVVDRGFCILFILFVLLKNIILNFQKKSYDPDKQSAARMFLRGRNYWSYAVLALIAYLVLLGVRSLFYYLLTYKLLVICIVAILIASMCYILYPQRKKIWLGAVIFAGVLTILCVIPTTNKFIDHQITEQIKHVQYRASIITQPIGKMLAENEYSSFSSKKIIETAENQWFINSYINKRYNNNELINLRAFTKVGVNYSTQTRDVVLARFVIGELGNFVMYLLLALLITPMLVYLLSYRIGDSTENNEALPYPKMHLGTYRGLLPLLLIFTIALFVWLTSTNRFVFFGQDFPFLSITSRLSVMLPMLLLFTTLIQKPQPYTYSEINFGVGLMRYGLLLAAAITTALVASRSNELNNESFNAHVPQAAEHINGEFNNILYRVQKELTQQGKTYNYQTLMRAVQKDKAYADFKETSIKDAYTRSIINMLEKDPSMATKVNSPVYITYDRGMYEAQYNKSLYLELPPTENKKVWNGNIVEAANATKDEINLRIGNNTSTVQAPYYHKHSSALVEFALVPAAWIKDATSAVAILNVNNGIRKSASIMMYSMQHKSIKQTAASYASIMRNGDLAFLQTPNGKLELSLSTSKAVYCTNKWLNGAYKTMYPLRENNFWVYHFANAVKRAYSADSNLLRTVPLTLDYELDKNVNTLIKGTYGNAQSQNKKFRFSVIAADGDGNIALMQDVVRNRIALDPNNDYAIYKLQQKHYFFSNTQNERDQWGNSNLTQMYLGPGSSIKPLVTASMASMVNAGWQNVQLNANMGAQVNNYAGLKLAIPWKNVDGESGIYDMPRYIEKSSNYYHSVMMFLGAYPKSAFADSNNKYSLKNILSTSGNASITPNLEIQGYKYYLPNYSSGKGNWPTSGTSKGRSYFANPLGIMATGLEVNANLATTDKNKQDYTPFNTDRANFTDSSFYSLLSANKSSSFLWSFPEQGAFLQQARHYVTNKKQNEIQENFLFGLQTPTLGGTPYTISAHKMMDMYAALFTQNRNYRSHVIPNKFSYKEWFIDSSWQQEEYKKFLAENIFAGMQRVVASGTAQGLRGAVADGYYIYAKTGTINDGDAKSSRRLVVGIANKDLTQASNIGKGTKVFTMYFMTDGTGDFDWNLLRQIISQTQQSNSFKNYFNK